MGGPYFALSVALISPLNLVLYLEYGSRKFPRNTGSDQSA
jgi:hypothetical protein